MEKLMKMEKTIRKDEIKGQKLYNKGKFEQAKKIWAKASRLRIKSNSLRCELQIRI